MLTMNQAHQSTSDPNAENNSLFTVLLKEMLHQPQVFECLTTNLVNNIKHGSLNAHYISCLMYTHTTIIKT